MGACGVDADTPMSDASATAADGIGDGGGDSRASATSSSSSVSAALSGAAARSHQETRRWTNDDLDSEDSMEAATSTAPITGNGSHNESGGAIKTTIIEDTDAGYKIIKPDGSAVEHITTSESEGQHEQLCEAAEMQKQGDQRTSPTTPSDDRTLMMLGPGKLYGDMQNQEVSHGPLTQSESEQAAAKVEQGIRNVQIASDLHDTLAESDDLRAIMAEAAALARNAPHAASHHTDVGGLAGEREASIRDFHDTDHFRCSASNFLNDLARGNTYNTNAMDAAAQPQPTSLFGGGGRSANAATQGFQVHEHDLNLGSDKPNALVGLANLNLKADAQAPEGEGEDRPTSPHYDDVPDAGEEDAHALDSDSDLDEDSSSEDNDDPSDGDYRGDGGERNMDADPCNIEDEEESQADGNDEDEAVHSYELRLAARQIRPIMTNILDWDESGDYDPSAKRPPKTPDKRPKPKRQREDGEESPTKRLRSARQLSPSKARQLGADWVVTLKLQSAAGKELLSKYPDNWPEEHSSFSLNNHIIAPPADDDDDSPTKRRMRPRRRLVHYGTPLSDDTHPVIADPTGEQDDLRNHPAARGCVRCRLVGQVCDLRKPGAVWPCVQCSEHFKDTGGHIPCELITRPQRKQECEPCQDQGLECSYAVEEGEGVQDDHSAPCRQCAASGERCIAGPRKDAIRIRATYSPPPGVRYFKYRAYISCTECRRRKKHCSLRSKEDEPPCVSCSDTDVYCTFERIVPVTKMVSNGEDATPGPGKAEPLKRDQEPSTHYDAMQVDTKRPETGRSTNSWKASTEAAAGPFTDSNRKGKQRATDEATGPSAYYAKFMTKGQVVKMEESAMVRISRAKKPSDQGSVKLINPQSTLHVKKAEYVPSSAAISASTDDEHKMEMEDVHGNRGHVAKLFTAFAHPIRFSLDEAGCRFCEAVSYGLYGIGWRRPEVIAWSNECGYTEIEGGHRSEGVEATFMCSNCVRERFQVTGCDGIARHEAGELRSLWPMAMDRAEKEMAMTAQFGRLCSGKPAAGDMWCSVCVTPASFECCRSPAQGRSGCALKLCDCCHRELMGCGADGLQQLLKQKMWSEKAMTQLRADACFLQSEGILCNSVYEHANRQKSRES